VVGTVNILVYQLLRSVPFGAVDRGAVMKWWDESWNPVTGCTPISEGCKNCYAKRMTDRNLWGYDFTPRYHPERLNIPRKWKKPRRIFVCSMGDLFHEDITDVIIACIMTIIMMTPRHTYMILTKRPERMKEFFTFKCLARSHRRKPGKG